MFPEAPIIFLHSLFFLTGASSRNECAHGGTGRVCWVLPGSRKLFGGAGGTVIWFGYLFLTEISIFSYRGEYATSG